MSDPRIDRLRTRLAEDVLDPPALKAVLKQLPGAPSHAVGRVRRRLDQPERAPDRLWRPVPVLGLGLATVAMAAVASWPAAPLPLDRTFTSGEESVVADLPQGLHIQASGDGTLGGTQVAPSLQWTRGRLDVAVDEDQGLDLMLRTREATVRTRAGRVEVERDRAGTRVRVGQGAVAVACGQDSEHTLLAGDQVECWPTTATGLLGRAELQATQEAPLSARQATLDAAAGLPAEAAVAAGLGLAQVELHLAADEPVAALDAARATLALDPPVHATALQQVAAALALTEEGCEGARPHLTALAPTHPDAAAALADCTR